MSVTVISTTTPYCSAADFLTRYDWRPFARLMNDDDSTAVTRDDLLTTGTTEGARLYQILLDASGEVEAAVLLGKRYTPTDLQDLTGTAAGGFLRRIVADLALGLCYERRPGPNPWADRTQTARQLLNALGSGEMIFGTDEATASSIIDIVGESPQKVTDRNGMVVQMPGYFGTRGNRRPQY